ncbi:MULTISPECIES: hypothetical protein [unclassified Arcicella]|uniref:hypothetical protein n=1 Tax=unclassified Arcicella TaxID=2644986 RepID=UPI002858A2E0|nr:MULTISPECIES: hypothetical protein [unclassified Arcicella]MDR6563178.1 hypothetical protein [Arcicella sp. BE51]MDR6811671.1 hypothetical protein [Arcicella sp. BE140]MDR6823196.1 hypothetical protein [Arcicella sp. BE139]
MTTTTLKILTYILIFFLFVSCTNSTSQNTHESNASLTIPKSNFEARKSSIAINDNSKISVKVLTTGTFHNNEVWENADKANWFGLFKHHQSYYLQLTKIKTINVNDPFDEDENIKTGWEVTAENKDSCLILIEALSYLTDRKVESIPLIKNYVFPSDTIKFTYLEVDYKIFATGRKKKTQEDSEWFDVSDYKLYLIATINGLEKKSLLVDEPNFDDQMIELLFTGDIDGDGILDLIIDTSNHYNVSSPTIYLSKSANEGEIVKRIGEHTIVGC